MLFLANAKWASFIGRFLPVIRHLVSLPAGVFGMRLLPFAVITWIGATLWCGVLVALGFHFGESVAVLIRHWSNEIGIVACVIVGLFVLRFLLKGRKPPARGSRAEPENDLRMIPALKKIGKASCRERVCQYVYDRMVDES